MKFKVGICSCDGKPVKLWYTVIQIKYLGDSHIMLMCKSSTQIHNMFVEAYIYKKKSRNFNIKIWLMGPHLSLIIRTKGYCEKGLLN